MRISDWSSDVCSSDLQAPAPAVHQLALDVVDGDRPVRAVVEQIVLLIGPADDEIERADAAAGAAGDPVMKGIVLEIVGRDFGGDARSEEHTSELQSLMRISYAVFCLKKTNINTEQQI